VLDLRAEERADASAFAVRGGAGEVEGRGQDREPDERDQQARAGRQQSREGGEPEDSDGEVSQEVDRLEIGAALDEWCEEAGHVANLALSLSG